MRQPCCSSQLKFRQRFALIFVDLQNGQEQMKSILQVAHVKPANLTMEILRFSRKVLVKKKHFYYVHKERLA